jgi:hypothetical protein
VRLAAPTAVCAGILLVLGSWPGPARAQDTTVLAPEASAARAREVIQQAIRALGGPAYLNVKDITRSGRFSTFEHNGESTGTVRLIVMVKLPDKERIEYIFKREYETYIPLPIDIPFHKTGSAYEVHNGEQGWTLAGGGVDDLSPEAFDRVHQQRKKDINLLLRTRLNDPELVLRYTGQDTLDLKFVDWVEASSADRFTTRIAIDHSTHLPIHAVFLYRDRESGDAVQDDDAFSSYHLIQGVMTPMQISHDHNGWHISQVFLEDVKYNTGLSDSLFTREGLEQMWAKSGKSKAKN